LLECGANISDVNIANLDDDCRKNCFYFFCKHFSVEDVWFVLSKTLLELSADSYCLSLVSTKYLAFVDDTFVLAVGLVTVHKLFPSIFCVEELI
jgi:hypothetical protein